MEEPRVVQVKGPADCLTDEEVTRMNNDPEYADEVHDLYAGMLDNHFSGMGEVEEGKGGIPWMWIGLGAVGVYVAYTMLMKNEESDYEHA